MILIIAYGNSLRQDDGAGFLVAEQLENLLLARQLKVERRVTHQLTPELAAEIARKEVTVVVFVDACLADPETRRPQVQVEPLAVSSAAPPLGHHLEPVVLLLYAHRLYNHQPPAWQVTVPGVAFEHGETLSPMTQAALTIAPAVLADWLDELTAQLRPSAPPT